MIKKKTTSIAIANSHTAPLSHDVVDLTEEDDDGRNVNKVSTQKNQSSQTSEDIVFSIIIVDL